MRDSTGFDTREQTRSHPRLAYGSAGSGTPVLLVMGLGMRGAAWAPQIGPLAHRHRVVFFDNRGLGHSAPLDSTSQRFSMATLGRDVLRLMDDLELDDAHLVGVSLGGMVAQHAALEAPGRFRSLSLLATHAGGPLAWVPTGSGIRQFVRSQAQVGRRRLDALEALLYPPEYRARADRAALDARMEAAFGRPPPRDVQRRQLLAVMGHDTRARLRSLSLPTLVVSPDRDLLVRPDACRSLAELLPNATLRRLPDDGHGLIYSAADRINAWLLEHFARAEAPVAVAG